MKRKVLIMGAAGRDFHNFNVYYRNNSDYKVMAFTATQIPDIAGRKYPSLLCGPDYPNGIPIYDEKDMPALIKEFNIDEVVFSYSDVSFNTVMAKGSIVLAAGADYSMLSAEHTMIKSRKPVVAVCAVRTGCGKSQTSRKIASLLKEMGQKVVVIRHPMPYGDLEKQICQRFASINDMKRYNCTIEEMEEYEPHIGEGHVVYAGIDYGKILEEAEKEADVILWDGGNNDLPFYKPDMHIVVTDPHRPGHEETYHPGTTNLRMADVVVINKVDTARSEDVEKVKKNIIRINPSAKIIKAESPIEIKDPRSIKGKKVLVVEDGPTLTHGEMKYGAGFVAAQNYGAREIIDPRPYAVGSIKRVYSRYPHLERILPAMGYGKKQMEELRTTINKSPAELVLIGTPINLAAHINLNKPSMRVKYYLREKRPVLKSIISEMLQKIK